MNIKLYQHQKQAVEFLASIGFNGAVFHPIGTGKTITGLSTFIEARKSDPDLKLLIICPISLIESAWIEDIQKYTTLQACNLYKKLILNKDIYIVNYQVVRSKKRMQELVNLVKTYPFMCILDESQALKTHNSLTTKTLLKLSSMFKYKIIMTGTPVCNTELDFWGQMNFIKQDILYSSFHQYKNTYFYLMRGNQVAQNITYDRRLMQDMFKKGWKYGMTEKSRTLLTQIIKPYCHRIKREECIDLPDKVFENRYIEMDIDQRKMYNDMKKYLIAEIKKDEYITAQNALVKLSKLRQICSGQLINETSTPIKFKVNPKLNELTELLEEIDSSEPVIIWCNFVFEVEDVYNMIKGKYGKDAVVTMYGRTEDKDESIRKFKSNTRFIVANTLSMAHGHTLTRGHIQIFYSLSYSYEQYEQSLGRTCRISQTEKCVYIHLLMKSSIEQNILDVVNKKKSLSMLVSDVLC